MKKFYLLILSLGMIFSLGLFASPSEKVAAEEVGEENTLNEDLKELLSSYYGLGVYKKDTTIYVDPAKADTEIATYFHAKVDTLERSTYYTKDALWMSRGDGSYSYYGTSYSDNAYTNPNGLTNGTADKPLAAPAERNVVLKGDNKNSMEEYYVTLNDFIEGTHVSDHSNNETLDLASGWVNNGGVYTNENPDVIDAFRLFTAPLWLGKTSENENYVDYTQVTVEEVGSKLMMKLWVSTGNSGLLVDDVEANADNLLFSKAVISKPNEGLNLQEYSKNLQEGFGTDFEGYSPETHSNLFDPNKTVSATNSGTWYEDNNGVKAYAHQNNYKIRLVEEADGNVALRIGGYTQKELFRVGLNMSGAVNEAGTYVAKLKVKRGENAVIPSLFFKINEAPYTDSKHPLSHYSSSNSSVTGIYFKNSSDPDLSTEWTEYSVTFTVAEGSSVDKSTESNFCAALVMYTSNSETNYKNDFILIDDFEVYRVDSCGTDFEGYSPETHPNLFDPEKSVSATNTGTWYEDNNGIKAYAHQSGYKIRLVEEADGNVALRIGGYTQKSLFRVGLNMSGEVNEAGTYVVKLKIKRGEDAVIPKFFFKINEYPNTDSNHSLSSSIYLKNESDPALSTDWVEYTVIFTVAEGSSVDKSTAENFCAAFVMYTSNSESEYKNDYVLIDDFEIYKYSFN